MFDSRETAQARVAFPATDPTLVDSAAIERGTGPAHERFCKLYWDPVYAFVRRSWPRLSEDEALEATQEFFTVRLEKRDLGKANQYGGRFHHWIIGAVSNLLRNRYKYERAEKRDQRHHVRLDALTADARSRLERKTTLDPLRLLERDLALGVLERALKRLESEHVARGEAVGFARQVQLIVPGESESSYHELERLWALPRDTLKARMHRMRARLANLVGFELGVPADDVAAQTAELDWLFRALDIFEPDQEPRLVANESKVPPLQQDPQGMSSCKSEAVAKSAPA